MTDAELIKWSHDTLSQYREHTIEMYRLKKRIDDYRDEIMSLHSSCVYDELGVKVQTSDQNRLETKMINLQTMKEELIRELFIHCTEDYAVFEQLEKELPTVNECVLVYRYHLDYSFERIAKIMGSCKNTVYRWRNQGLLMYGKLHCPDYKKE